MRVSVVIPCYNSEKSIKTVVELITKELSCRGYDFNVVLVNDGSKDGTWEQILEISSNNHYVKGIDLMRNFGQHNALMCALNHADGEYIVGMDDDLQTQPNQMHILLDKIQEGYDVVYGVYDKDLNSPIKRLTSWINRSTSQALIGKPHGIRSSNYWVIAKPVRDEIIKNKNHSPYVDAMFFRTTRRIANVTIDHHKREFGTSNYSLKKLIKLWLAYFNYSVLPLRIVSTIGIIMSFVGFIGGIYVIVSKIINPPSTVGWASLISLMLFFFGVVLFVLGILGEYIGNISLAINEMPQYIERERVNL